MKKLSIYLILVFVLLFSTPIKIAQKVHNPPIETEVIEKKVEPIPEPVKPEVIVKEKPIATKPTVTTPSRGDILDQDKVILLAKLIQSEALSESYEGKLWVGAVVINRMRVYDKSMKEIIYQKSQFSGIHSNLFNSKPNKDCIRAARELLEGNLVSRTVLYFVNLNIARPSWINNVRRITKIGGHTFYKD